VTVVDDLAEFARIELASHDLEPWAEILRDLRDHGDVDTEGVLWLVKLYNGYDDLSSAWSVYRRWPTPADWLAAPDFAAAANYPLTQERRGLRGGKVIKHLASYVAALDGAPQAEWVATAPYGDNLHVLAYLQQVYGVGRQTAFEWAEFLHKVIDAPCAVAKPADVMLWESEGPRRSLERIYHGGRRAPARRWLNRWAIQLRDRLANEYDVHLTWEDFETVICDFNVMRDGRYYPGKHLAAIREEIATVPHDDGRALLEKAFARVVPEPWCDIAPGIDKDALRTYRDTGQLATAVQR
jgi:amino acid-DNA transferase-like protein